MYGFQSRNILITTVLLATASLKGLVYIRSFVYSETLKLHVHYIFIVSKAKDELPQAVCLAMLLWPLHFSSTNQLCSVSTWCTEVHGRAEANWWKAVVVLVDPWSTCSVRRSRSWRCGGGVTLGAYAVANELWGARTTWCLMLLALLLELLCVEEPPSWSSSSLHGVTVSRLMKVWLRRKEFCNLYLPGKRYSCK